MTERQRKPPLTKELIQFLDDNFPDRLPRKEGISAAEIAFMQGQRNVVDFLIQLFEQE